MRSLLLAAFLMITGAVNAQMLGAPLVSTSMGGVVSATYGYFTYISATNGLGGAGATSATTAVAFNVNKNGTGQTVTNQANVKLTWSNEVFDTNNNFASNRFTPTIAGKYLVHLQLGCADVYGSPAYSCNASIYKNGANIAGNGVQPPDGSSYPARPVAIAIVDMNGSTDYLEAYAYLNTGYASPVVSGTTATTYFEGALLGPGQVSSGSTTSGDRIVSGTTGMVAQGASSIISITNGGTTTGYFNSNGVLTVPGISATANLTSVTTLYASGNVGIGTSAPAYPLDVSSSTGIRSTASGSGYSVLQPGSWAATGYVGFYTSATTRLGYVGWGLVNSTLSLMTDASTTSLSLGTSGTTQVLINGSGNVGIGTMSPNAKLEVNGAISATQLVVPGTWCGMRTITSQYCASATPPYGTTNVPCAGTAITSSCTYTYFPGDGYYWMLNMNTINCPAGYLGVRTTGIATTTSDTNTMLLSCIKN